MQALWLAVCAGFVCWAVGFSGPRVILVKPLEQGPPGKLKLRVDKGCGGVYKFGDRLQVELWSERSGYLTLFDFAPDGKVYIIFPNQFRRDNHIEGGVWHRIPGSLYPFEFVAAPPGGEEILFAVVTERKIDFIPRHYYEFTTVFPELPKPAEEAAEEVARGLEVIPAGEWWAAAICFLFTGEPPLTKGWGVFVGINEYEHSPCSWIRIDRHSYSLDDLTYCVADSQAMAAALAENFGRQRVLTDGEATLQGVREGFEWLSQAPEDATALFYFSGHGARVKDEDGDEEDGWDEGIVLYDRVLLLDDELAGFVASLRAGKVVLIVDSCHSGTIHRGIRTFHIREEARPLFPPLEDGFLEDIVRAGTRAIIRPKQVVALTACRPDEEAAELPELGHGVFTYFLLQDLKGPADLDGDGRITAQELYRFAAERVVERFLQEPRLHDPVGRPIPLLEVRW